jgi:hypothetical protein
VSHPINCIVFPCFFHHRSNLFFIALRITFFALPLDHLYKTTARKPIPSLPHSNWFPDEWVTLKAAEAPCLYHSPCSFPLHADAPKHLCFTHTPPSCTMCCISVVAYIVIVNNNFYSDCKHRCDWESQIGACAEPSQTDASRVLSAFHIVGRNFLKRTLLLPSANSEICSTAHLFTAQCSFFFFSFFFFSLFASFFLLFSDSSTQLQFIETK